MTTELFTCSYIDVDIEYADASTVSVDLTQIQDWGPSPNIENALMSGAGEVDPTHYFVQSTAPRFSATSTQLNDVLDNIGIDGCQIDAEGTTSGVIAYLKQMDKGGTRKSSTDHISMTMAEGLIVPRTLDASQDGGPATISLDFIASYDGTNDPIVIAKDQSIATTPSADSGWVLGKVDVNGTSLEADSVSIDFGINEVVRSSDGDPFPTFSAIMTRQPTVTATVGKATYYSTTGIYGTEQTNDVTFYFRKATQGGTRVADGTSQHIKVVVSECMIQPQDTTWSNGQEALLPLRFVPRYDGTNDILSITTDTTIT